MFIFQGDYEKLEIDSTTPYCTVPLTDIIRIQLFTSHDQLGPKVAWPKTAGRFQLTTPIVALAASALHTSISQYTSDKYFTASFSGNASDSAYQEHVRFLDEIAESDIDVYNMLMAKLYSTVSRECKGKCKTLGGSKWFNPTAMPCN